MCMLQRWVYECVCYKDGFMNVYYKDGFVTVYTKVGLPTFVCIQRWVMNPPVYATKMGL